MWHQWQHHSCYLSSTWGCSRRCPSRWTTSSLSTSMAPPSGSRIPLQAQHGPSPQWCSLEKDKCAELEEVGWKVQNDTRATKLTTSWFIVDAVAVENKRAMWSINTDGHRPMFEDRHLQGWFISRCHVGVTLDLSHKLGWVHMAKSILLKERNGKFHFLKSAFPD